MIGADKFIGRDLAIRDGTRIWNSPRLGEREGKNFYNPITLYNRDKGLRDLV